MTEAPGSLSAGDLLADATLIYVAPRSGESGVGDYADTVTPQARKVFGRVVEIRSGGAGADSVREILAHRRAIAAVIAQNPGPIILHGELSGGVLAPFWAMTVRRARSARVRRTAVVHDAPLGVWLPLRTKLIGRSWFVTHLVHYPFMRIWSSLERRVLAGVTLATLTTTGSRATAAELGHERVTPLTHPVPPRAELPAASSRPRAIGLFGYVYRGKGFDALAELRARVDSEIEIHVAGRGTDALDPVPGVTILGAVDGDAEDAFFAGIRAIVLPYARRSSYGPEMHVASGVLARAIAYRTPVIALRYPGLDDDEAETVIGDIGALAACVNRIVPDDAEIDRLAVSAGRLREARTGAASFEGLAALWRDTLCSADGAGG